MKVHLIARISGTRNGEDWPQPGETFEVPADEGHDLIRAKLAVEVKKAASRVETATSPAPETATRRSGLSKGNTGL